jgi:hypothetical protein
MLTWFIKKRLAAFENKFDYNVDYARQILAADTRAFLQFARLGGLSFYRRDVPSEVYYAVKLTSVVLEDCGPCTQLMVAMALRDGVKPATIASILRDPDAVLADDVRLGVRFARAVAAHDVVADELRADIVRRWGPRALVSLAFAITAARLYPTLKYALGHGKACQRVEIAGETVAPRSREPALAAVRGA